MICCVAKEHSCAELFGLYLWRKVTQIAVLSVKISSYHGQKLARSNTELLTLSESILESSLDWTAAACIPIPSLCGYVPAKYTPNAVLVVLGRIDYSHPLGATPSG